MPSMLEKLEEYIIAKSVPEAVKLLRRDPPGSAVAITGAIDLHWWRLQNARRFVDTSRLGLDKIRLAEGRLRLGAAAMLEDLVRSPACQRFAGGLIAEAARSLASMPRRQSTSVAALLINAVAVVDLVPALMVLDAAVHVQGGRKRVVPVADLFPGKGRTVLDRELIVEAVIPKPAGKMAFAIERNGLTPSDDPILTATVGVAVERGAFARAAVAVGGGVPVPARVAKAEQALAGHPATAETIARAAEIFAAAIHPVDDARCTAAHRREIAKVLARRALTRAAGLDAKRRKS